MILEYQRFSSEMMVRLKTDRFDNAHYTEKRQVRIKFAIGMVVIHLKNSLLNAHKGVILAWHNNYRRAFVDKMMDFNIRQISSICDGYRFHNCRVRNHPMVTNNPHYVILTEDSGLCYVQQENIKLCEPSEIRNVEIGRYFSSFNGLFYVPNENMSRNYPQDSEYLNTLFHETLHYGRRFDLLRTTMKLEMSERNAAGRNGGYEKPPDPKRELKYKVDKPYVIRSGFPPKPVLGGRIVQFSTPIDIDAVSANYKCQNFVSKSGSPIIPVGRKDFMREVDYRGTMNARDFVDSSEIYDRVTMLNAARDNNERYVPWFKLRK